MYEDPNTTPSPEQNGYSGNSSSSSAPASEYGTKKRGLTTGKIVALALVCALLGGCLGAGGMLLASRGARAEAPVLESVTPEPTSAPETTAAAEATAAPEESRETAAFVDDGQGVDVISSPTEPLPAKEVYANNVNSTVGIKTSITTNYWGYQTTAAASGSGFILSADGYILTNYHVVDDSNSITVTTYDNQSYEASIVGYDESNDIAVLKIDAEGLTPVVLGDSDTLSVGDTVVAIGNPLGELTFSLTQGVVSALGREVTFSSGSTMALIQTDCAINSGNSGGALFNMYGEVVGITNAKYSTSSGSSASVDNIGFAIPINHVKGIVDSIIQYGYIVRPYIGVQVSTVTEELKNYGIPQGAAIRVINEDSPAQAAGLQVNDVITAVNGSEITSSADLVKLISQCKPGDELTLTVYRQGEEDLLTLTITVGEQKQDASAPQESESPQEAPSGGYNPFEGFPFGYGFGGFG